MTTLNEEQAEMAAALIHTIRPDWDEGDIYRLLETHLATCEGTDLIIALLTAARDPRCSTPTLLNGPGVRCACTAEDQATEINYLESLLNEERRAG